MILWGQNTWNILVSLGAMSTVGILGFSLMMNISIRESLEKNFHIKTKKLQGYSGFFIYRMFTFKFSQLTGAN